MLTFEISPAVLRPLVSAATELDQRDGIIYVSVVAFRFLSTRVLRVRVPGHVDFDEANLRFYVRRRAGTEWRRGVVLVSEMVPRRAIAWAARRWLQRALPDGPPCGTASSVRPVAGLGKSTMDGSAAAAGRGSP